MADSTITKHALAAALKELMLEIPFAKICVADICKKCHMNRKSFYYHFRDKYDLMHWIFDTDFVEITSSSSANNDSIEDIIRFFRILYENRTFYSHALSVHGQNSLLEHIRELALPIFRVKLSNVLPSEENNSFYYEFFLDSLFIAIIRWITDKDCEPPEQFLTHLLSYIISFSKHILEIYSDSERANHTET